MKKRLRVQTFETVVPAYVFVVWEQQNLVLGFFHVEVVPAAREV